jgi:predicted transcriptional regulator
MVKALELAIERVRKLPADRQEFLAIVLDEFTSDSDAIYSLSQEERALVEAGLADIDAGRIVSDADMAAFWNRHGS